jgi:hypothetical protein
MRNIFLVFVAKMMSGTNNSLSSKCEACHSLVTNGLICTDCGCYFYLNCASTSPIAPDRIMPWCCVPCKYQQHVKQQERRIMNLEKELKAAKEEICKLEAGSVNNNFMEQDISGNWEENKKFQLQVP